MHLSTFCELYHVADKKTRLEAVAGGDDLPGVNFVIYDDSATPVFTRTLVPNSRDMINLFHNFPQGSLVVAILNGKEIDIMTLVEIDSSRFRLFRAASLRGAYIGIFLNRRLHLQYLSLVRRFSGSDNTN